MQTRSAEVSGSTLRLAKTMIQREGLCSLYRGVMSPMLGYGLINGSVFFSRSLTKNALLKRNQGGALSFAQECLVGASAGFWSSFVRCPVERVKT
jgi:hypothetical protein